VFSRRYNLTQQMGGGTTTAWSVEVWGFVKTAELPYIA